MCQHCQPEVSATSLGTDLALVESKLHEAVRKGDRPLALGLREEYEFLSKRYVHHPMVAVVSAAYHQHTEV